MPRVRVRLRVRRAVLFPTARPTVFHGMFHGRAPLGISVIGSGFGGLDQVGRVIGDRASRDGSSPVSTLSIAQSMALMVA